MPLPRTHLVPHSAARLLSAALLVSSLTGKSPNSGVQIAASGEINEQQDSGPKN